MDDRSLAASGAEVTLGANRTTSPSSPIDPEPSSVSDVNPHYLDHLVRLSETSDIEVSEDILSGSGMKLLAKGTKIDARVRERLLEFRLDKPLENMMRVVGGIDPKSIREAAERLLDTHALLRGLCGTAGDVKPLVALKAAELSPNLQSLLSVYAGRSDARLEHAVGVALVSIALGGDLSTNPADHAAMVVAGLAHDVGELYIDPAFLARGVKLAPQQWKHVATHPIVGSHVLGTLPGAGPRIASVVMAHHERLDGFGYPQGLLGSSVPMAGQVLAAAEMLMGVIECGNHEAERAAVAMRLVPGEFNRRFIDRVAQGARAGARPAGDEDAPSGADLLGRVAGLGTTIHRVRELRGGVALEMARFGAPLRSLLTHAFERWERIGVAFSSTGLDLGAAAPLAAMGPADRVEVGIVLRELRWRITELERQLLIRSELLAPSDARRVQELIEQARQPSASELSAA
jgi:hypothetical protein